MASQTLGLHHDGFGIVQFTLAGRRFNDLPEFQVGWFFTLRQAGIELGQRFFLPGVGDAHLAVSHPRADTRHLHTMFRR